MFAPSAKCCVRNWCPELIFSFKIKTRTNARIFPNLRLDQKCILEKFFVILYAQNKDASDFPSTNNYLRNVREREKMLSCTYILDYWECNKILYTSTWLNHSCNSSLYWDILLPIHRRWWQYFNLVCTLVSVNHLCQKVFIQVIICVIEFFLGR